MTTPTKHCIYVHHADGSRGYAHYNNSPYGISIGGIVLRSDRAGALAFDTVDAANRYINQLGYINSTSVKPGWSTAYTAHYLETK